MRAKIIIKKHLKNGQKKRMLSTLCEITHKMAVDNFCFVHKMCIKALFEC
ncbi:hypothetical protein AsAng_0055170 [Aureispira anguillae]|uniref:Uncharacterized protein n=1 Tax=Aureispira anguillae TaxID=2864201 RepID=A0A915YK59_9BACT|nr:hypothetical protein AsAng_0055170 [Aureispira anguillae]